MASDVRPPATPFPLVRTCHPTKSSFKRNGSGLPSVVITTLEISLELVLFLGVPSMTAVIDLFSRQSYNPAPLWRKRFAALFSDGFGDSASKRDRDPQLS